VAPRAAVLVASGGVLLLAGGALRGAPAARAEEGAATAKVATPRPVPDLETAIRRGVRYLLDAQRPDGSWGSTAPTLIDIYAPQPGSSQTFAVASTALALSGLIEVGGDAPEVKSAVDRATKWLVEHHGVRRVSLNTIYNVWAHAYALECFARLLARETDPERRKVFQKEAEVAVERLDRFRFVEGGWGYYDFDVRAKMPGPGSTSFTTATVLVALEMARRQGVPVPRRLLDNGVKLVQVLRFPSGSFAYSYDHRYYPQGGINKIKGSLARTPACYLALRDVVGAAEVTDAQIEKALDDLHEEGHFLLIARKYPIPHETWYQNSGYFAFYGYYYASRCIERLPAEKRDAERSRLAAALLPLQEDDGSFWDYQLFGYHKAYGTGYVLSTLGRCRPGAPVPLDAPARATPPPSPH
jgi:hypothetical protein